MNFARYFTILFLLIALPHFANGQQLLLSPDEYLEGTNGTVKVIGNIGDTAVSFLESYAGFELLWHDSIMRKLGTTTLDFLESGAEDIRFYVGTDAAYIFYQKKKRKHVELWGAQVPPLHKDTVYPRLIDSVELSGAWDKTRFVLHQSDIENRFAYSLTNYDSRENKLNVQAVLLDKNLFRLQTTTDQVSEVVRHEIIDICIDDANGIHILFGEMAQRENQMQHLLIGSQRMGEQKMEYQKLDLTGYQMADANLFFDKKSKKIILAGLLYTSGSNQLAALGKYTYDPTNQQWQAPIITQVSLSLGLKQNYLSNVFLRKIITREDGGSVFILEKAFEEIYQRNRSIGFVSPGLGMASSSYSVYHNDEIFVLNTSATGKLDWYEVIEKAQETSDANGRFQSFGTLEYPSGTVFLFNDQSSKTRRFITAFLSNGGKLTLRQFSSSTYPDIEDTGLLLRSAKQVGTDEIVFPMVKRGTLTFAKIKF